MVAVRMIQDDDGIRQSFLQYFVIMFCPVVFYFAVKGIIFVIQSVDQHDGSSLRNGNAALGRPVKNVMCFRQVKTSFKKNKNWKFGDEISPKDFFAEKQKKVCLS